MKTLIRGGLVLDVAAMIVVPTVAAREFWKHRQWAKICRSRVAKIRSGYNDGNYKPMPLEFKWTYPKYERKDGAYEGYIGRLWKKLLTLGCTLVPEKNGDVTYSRWCWDHETAEKRKGVGKKLLLTEKNRAEAAIRLRGRVSEAAHYRVWAAFEELMSEECVFRAIPFQHSDKPLKTVIAIRNLISDFPKSVCDLVPGVRWAEVSYHFTTSISGVDFERHVTTWTSGNDPNYFFTTPLSGGDLNYILSKFRHNIAFDSDDCRDKGVREILRDALERQVFWGSKQRLWLMNTYHPS